MANSMSLREPIIRDTINIQIVADKFNGKFITVIICHLFSSLPLYENELVIIYRSVLIELCHSQRRKLPIPCTK